MDADGYPVPPRGWTGTGFGGIAGNRGRMFGQRVTMQQITEALKTLLKCPVVNATGLSGKYDFAVHYSGGLGADGPRAELPAPSSDGAIPSVSDPSGLPDVFAALESELGLKPERKKIPVEMMMLDHMEKDAARKLAFVENSGLAHQRLNSGAGDVLRYVSSGCPPGI